MQVNPGAGTPRREGRRAQIVAATIATIAESGYRHASFAAIARQGGLSSTRLISYHFDDRDDLMRAVAHDIVERLARHVGERGRSARRAADALEAVVRAHVDFVDTHRPDMVALTALFGAGALHLSAEHAGGGERGLTELLRAGIDAGEFRPVDPGVAALVVQRALEGVSLRLHTDPRTDLTGVADELVAFFAAALRPTPPGGGRR
jgi:AcrR family transcriptional regulator